MKHLVWSLYIVVSIVLFFMGCSAEKPENAVKTEAPQQTKQVPATNEAAVVADKTETVTSGEALFRAHCIKCHKNGGNIINRSKPINRTALASRNITTPEAIVRVMRNPGKGMKMYTEEQIPDSEALKIGEYILNTFTD